MLTYERYQAILELLNNQNAVTVVELSQLLNTSESTIRRDLNALDKMGKLNKVFGGATQKMQTSGVLEENVNSRKALMKEEKDIIGKYAASLINDHDFVFIDSGTTTFSMLEYIVNEKATYATNGIPHAQRLLQKCPNTYIIGGKIKPVTEAVVGAEGIRNMANFNFTKAFMGTNGIDLNAGFTTPDVEEALIKEEAVNKSYMAFILADHSKFHRVYPVTFSKLEKCCIITDTLPYKEFSEKTVIKEVKI